MQTKFKLLTTSYSFQIVILKSTDGTITIMNYVVGEGYTLVGLDS
jgi:hypothetical protein